MARQVCSCLRTRVRESAWDRAEGLGLGRGSQGCPPPTHPAQAPSPTCETCGCKGSNGREQETACGRDLP